MHILHGSWRIQPAGEAARFVLWAETSIPQTSTRAHRERRSARGAPPRHPFAASAREIRDLVRDLAPAAGDLLAHDGPEPARAAPPQLKTALLWLPSAKDGPEPSTNLLRPDGETAATGKRRLLAWQVELAAVTADWVATFLAGLSAEQDTPPGVRIGADLRYWAWVAEFALALVARQRFWPVLLPQDGKYLARWEPLVDEPADRERLARLARAMPPICRAFVSDGTKGGSRGSTPQELLDDFLSTVIDGFARQNGYVGESKGSLAEDWLEALCLPDAEVKESAATLNAFYEQYRAWAGAAAGSADTFRICFRLDPPGSADGDGIVAPKPKARDWKLRYLLQANDDPSLLVPAKAVWRERGSSLEFLNRRFDAPQEHMLAGLGLASRIFAPIETSLRGARPEECALDVRQAYAFMRETAVVLQSSGFGVLVPGLGGKLSVHLNLKPAKRSSQQKGGVAGLTLDSLVSYDWQLALGGEPLSREEFDRLAALKVPLVQVRGQWIELHPEQVEQAIRFWDKHGASGELPTSEALRLALGAQDAGPVIGLPIANVSTEGWIADLLEKLGQGERVHPVPVPPTFHGMLRHYQAAGLSWMAFLRQWGLGACLADDMGLGKTPTTIALLAHENAREQDHKPALVICPTSVVSNWQQELARFAPGLRVHVHHGAGRKKAALAAQTADHDVVLSSYALLHRDEPQLAGVEWSALILDEAQNIKNSTTKQAQAARRIGEHAEWRAALTGTPVENRLTELWSIFQFLNPGLLGSQADFYNRFARPIERTNDADAAKTLRSLVGPFILRRVKTDPNVISDLPTKNEIKVLINLTKEQATLYEAVVCDSLQRIAGAQGIERRGVVLATLTRLKQVCNHPAQYLGDGSALAGRSGKLARLTEMLDEVRSVRERALIFTQFAEMGQMLKAYLQEYLADEVLFLHGGTPAKARPKMIDRFQNDPNGPSVFVLSIKAGGTGLNLTRANHVFHFDRWWNPAVENQATDRAFRIGQTKNVQVWKFLCAGTFEEKIDEMIERKKALAETIVGASESWLTELSTEQLRDLLALRREEVPA